MALGTNPHRFKNQDYNVLKKQQLSRGVKFVDEEFGLDAMHLNSVDISVNPVELRRPTDLTERPCLSCSESYFSLRRGFVQNFKIILAFTSLRYNVSLWNKVIPDFKSQNWDLNHINEHPGIFKFRFWQEGVLLDVVVDDLLPCQQGKVICLSSSSASEFWPTLLEKAYAKLLGGYDKLEVIHLEEVLMHLTGGVIECIDVSNLSTAPAMKQVEFFEKLEESVKEKMMTIFCTGPVPKETGHDPPMTNDQDTIQAFHFGNPSPFSNLSNPETGLYYLYGYLMTRVCVVPKDVSLFGAFKDAFRRAGDCPIRERLLRLRCPLTSCKGGTGLGEWIGAYSSSSQEWDDIGMDARRRLGLCFDSEADFWIPFSAVLKHMSGVVICHIPDTSLINITGPTFQLNEHHGAWFGHQTGGSLRYRETFLHNPQYYFDINGDNEQVLISLVRKYDRDPLTLAIEPEFSITPMGLALFQVENNRTVRVHQLTACRTIHVEAAQPHRISLVRSRLNYGRYVVIPFLDQPLSTAAYLLRLYLPKRTESRELTLDIPINSVQSFFFGDCKEAVRVHIANASNLLWPDGKNPPSPYCIISSEDSDVRTTVRHSNNNPIWNESFIFYRRRPKRVPIVIQIMDKRTLGFDVFLGRHCFKESEIAQRGQQEVMLFGRDKKEERYLRMKGALTVEFFSVTSEDFMQI